MPIATVAAVVLKNRKILLEKRNIEPFKGYWCLPGGHIETGEKAEDAVKRELKEETGLKPKKCEFLFYVDEIFPRFNFHAIVLVFRCDAYGKLTPQKTEVSELKWFDIEKSLKLKLAFNHKKIIKMLLKHR